MAMTWRDTPLEIAPVTTGSFQDVDLSSDIASGATGVALEFHNKHATLFQLVGWQKKGSSDNITATIRNIGHNIAYCGVDDSRICQIYVAASDIDVYLVGEFADDAFFFTNSPDKSTTTTNSYVDVDIATDTGDDTAIGAFFQLHWVTGGQIVGYRKKGSGDAFEDDFEEMLGFAIGVDGSEVCQQFLETSADIDLALNGYVTKESNWNTNATENSRSAANGFADLNAAPAGSIGTFFHIDDPEKDNNWDIRRKGDTQEIFAFPQKRVAAHATKLDASRIAEGRIQTTTLLDFWEVGYSEAAVASEDPIPPLLVRRPIVTVRV